AQRARDRLRSYPIRSFALGGQSQCRSSIPRPTVNPMSRRVLRAFVGSAAAGLLPWTIYLAQTLPDRHASNSWKLAWVGFDTGLLLLFAAATVLGLRRRRAAVPL